MRKGDRETKRGRSIHLLLAQGEQGGRRSWKERAHRASQPNLPQDAEHTKNTKTRGGRQKELSHPTSQPSPPQNAENFEKIKRKKFKFK